ncbi:MAG: PhzF family phenazine biosynthesis protein [Saccharofermentanales bacterium]
MKYYVIDVFTDELFKGNPAGVCLLDEWLPDKTLQNIALENNLSETAFLVKSNNNRQGYYDLRWFTPSIEIDLCGHATLASAYVLFNYYENDLNELSFKTMSGTMKVTKADSMNLEEKDILFLDFPSRKVERCPEYETFEKAFGVKPASFYKAADFLLLFNDEEIIRNIKPDFEVLKKIKEEAGLDIDNFGIIITAKAKTTADHNNLNNSGDCDFVSRFFAPNAGINEDPVTGRAQCSLIPFWSERLGKAKMTAKQLSKRGGHIICEDCGERVKIGGRAVCYLVGEIEIQ